MSLDLRDVVTQDRALRVLGKGNKERLAYVPAGAWQRLQIWIDEIRGETPGPLFTRIRRFGDVTLNRLTDQAVYHILQVRQGQAGITKCSPHDLRRTFATAMLDNGEDLITVKDAMGTRASPPPSSMTVAGSNACRTRGIDSTLFRAK